MKTPDKRLIVSGLSPAMNAAIEAKIAAKLTPSERAHLGLAEPAKTPEPRRGAWKTMKRTDPLKEAAVEAIRKVYRVEAAKTGKPFPGNPRVNALQVSKDGTKVRGRVVPVGQGYDLAPTGVYEADLPGGPAPARLMDRFKLPATPGPLAIDGKILAELGKGPRTVTGLARELALVTEAVRAAVKRLMREAKVEHFYRRTATCGNLSHLTWSHLDPGNVTDYSEVRLLQEGS